MTVARDYLMGFCQRNEAGMDLSGWLEPLHFFNSASARLSQQDRGNALGEASASAEWHDFAPAGPKPVKVTLRPVAAQPAPPSPAGNALAGVRLMDDDDDDKASDRDPNAAPSAPEPKLKVEPKVNAAPSAPEPKLKVEPKVNAAPSMPGPKLKVEPKVNAAPSVPEPKMKVEPQVKLEQKAKEVKAEPEDDLMLPPPPPEERLLPMKRPAASTPASKAKLAKSPKAKGRPKGKAKGKAKAAAKSASSSGRHISPNRWPANRNGLGCPKCTGRWDGCSVCKAFKAKGKAWPEGHVPRGHPEDLN